VLDDPLLRERTRLSDTLERWTGLEGDAEDAAVLLELAVEAEDEETAAEAREALAGLERGVRWVELERMFSGPHDLDPCFLAVNAGAGGSASPRLTATGAASSTEPPASSSQRRKTSTSPAACSVRCSPLDSAGWRRRCPISVR